MIQKIKKMRKKKENKKVDRIKITETRKIGDFIDLDVTCSICGKPISKSNEYGMFCEDECGMAEEKEAYLKVKDIFDGFMGGVFKDIFKDLE
jgi:hypothetical protein